MAGVAVLAFVARLVPVVRGGGLYGLGNYDDGVYYSAAVGLVHGRLPYRDFLLLHPPGVVLALAPFAVLGRLWGDPTGFAVARVAWMGLGALNTVLVVGVLRSQGKRVAVLGGAFYALFLPAVYSEHTTQLEALGSTCLLVAIMLLAAARPQTWRVPAVAGAALGVATSVKIWGAAMVVLAAAWLWATAGRRTALWLVAGAVGAVTAVCLPFFVAAPAAMFQMVVRDQLGRPRVSTPMPLRLTQLVGLWTTRSDLFSPVLLAALLAFGVLAAFAAVASRTRAAPAGHALVQLTGLTALLLLTPTWFKHYAALIAAPLAVTVGVGMAQFMRWVGGRWPRAAPGAAVGLSVLVALYAVPVNAVAFGHRFPGPALGAVVASSKGCITADDPATLVEMNVLGRSLDRGCPLVVDLGGWSYHQPTPGNALRAHNRAWQRYALAYLGSGASTLVVRFSSGQGFSPATAATVKGWPVVRRVGRFALRHPVVPGRPTRR